MAATRQLSHVYPLGSRLNERGRLEVGGCDAIELAREFGTPAYVVAEDDLRGRGLTLPQAETEAKTNPFVERALRRLRADPDRADLQSASWTGIMRENRSRFL